MSNNLLKRLKLFTSAVSSGSGAAVRGTITTAITSGILSFMYQFDYTWE